MRAKTRIAIVAALISAAAVVSAIAVASNVHFVGTPTCTQSGGTLTCTGSLAGLGSQTTVIQLSARFECTNRGGHQPGGLASGQTAPITPRNGRVNFTVSATGSCPDQMTPSFGSTATITAIQGGQTVFTGTVPIT